MNTKKLTKLSKGRATKPSMITMTRDGLWNALSFPGLVAAERTKYGGVLLDMLRLESGHGPYP